MSSRNTRRAEKPAAAAASPNRKFSFEYDPKMFNKEDDCLDSPKSEFCTKIVAENLGHHGLIRLEIPDDGNCFFYSLRAWVLLNRYEGLAVNGIPLLKMNHKDMRKFIISFGQANTSILRPFYEFNNNSNSLSNSEKDDQIKRALGELKKDKSWALGAGDYLPFLAAEALQLNLHIYNWTWRSRDSGTFYEVPIIINPELPIVTILRINNNHYDLLIPKDEAAEEKIKTFNTNIKPKLLKTKGGRSNNWQTKSHKMRKHTTRRRKINRS